MKTLGIIAEYNPCHKGHIYHIEQSKIHSGADCVVIIMSGNFVQRGAPAIADKFFRTELALKSGADLVIELPTIYSCASAEFFSKGAISILDSLQIDYISFGMEKGTLNDLSEIVNILCSQPSTYRILLKSFLNKGYNMPTAREKALVSYMENDISKKMIATPNNILAIEYLKALSDLQSKIQPIGITRKSSNYHDQTFTGKYPSATAVRNMIINQDFSGIDKSLDENVASLIKSNYNSKLPVSLNDFSDFLYYSLHINKYKLEDFWDIDENLANRIRSILENGEIYTYTQMIEAIKSKHLTYTRISRSLLHVMLNIKSSDITNYLKNQASPYARVLGFNSVGQQFLNNIKHNEHIQIITKPAQFINNTDELSKQIFETDLFATTLYNAILQKKYGTTTVDDYRNRPIIIL